MQQRTLKSIEVCSSSQIEKFGKWWSSQEENFERGVQLQMKKKKSKPKKPLRIKKDMTRRIKGNHRTVDFQKQSPRIMRSLIMDHI